jgi:hypothetical protein
MANAIISSRLHAYFVWPRHFWIENPQTSRTKDYITDLPCYDVDYCMYSDWGYRKRFWTDISDSSRSCTGGCGYNIGKRQVPGMADIGGGGDRARRYHVPARLIEALLAAALAGEGGGI